MFTSNCLVINSCICASVFINVRQILFFLFVCVLNYFYVVVFYLQTILQYGLDGFVQDTVPQAAKIFAWYSSLPSVFPAAFLQLILAQNRGVYTYFFKLTLNKSSFVIPQ